MLKKSGKTIAGIFIFFLFLLLSSSPASSQAFNDLPKSEYDDGFVDPFLPTEESLGTLTIDKNNWDLRYYDLIYSASVATDDMQRQFTRVAKDKKTGKTIAYQVYDSPYIYYSILDMPSGDRFYGIVTTGYDDMETILNKPKDDWHPYTKIQPVSGTIVDANGNQSDFFLYSDSDWQKLKITKPLGTYHVDDFRGYERVSFTFNQGGSGSMTLLPYVHTQQFMTFSGGDLKKKTASGRVKRRVNVVMGGPHSWQITAKRNFKWAINDRGDLEITPTGAVTIIPKDWIPEDTGNTYYTSKADSIRSRRQAENDHKYLHDEIIEYNKDMKISAKEKAEQFKPITIQNPLITKKEIVGVQEVELGKLSNLISSQDIADGKYGDYRIYLGPKLDDEMKVAYVKEVYNKIPALKRSCSARRDHGVDIQYSKWKDRTKILVVKNKDIFGSAPVYTVFSPSVKNGKANIVFYNNGKRCLADLYFDEEGKIDIDRFKQSITVDNKIEENFAKIAQLDSEIMAYKKDKRRKKVVKAYEKSYNLYYIPSAFSNASEFNKIVERQEELLKEQQETLELLK